MTKAQIESPSKVDRKLYPQPGTKAERLEWFVSVADDKRKLYDLQGPLTGDQSALARVTQANETRNGLWHVCAAVEGPSLAEMVRRQAENAVPGYAFVDSALAEEPRYISVAEQPLSWTYA